MHITFVDRLPGGIANGQIEIHRAVARAMDAQKEKACSGKIQGYFDKSLPTQHKSPAKDNHHFLVRG